MPKLWEETIDAHRRAVRDATLDATAALVSEHGLASVTMSQIAERTGIARATLYRNFGDVDEILVAWHERQVAQHLAQLTAIRDKTASGDRLAAVLHAFAMINHHSGTEPSMSLHRRDHVTLARQRLSRLVQELLDEGVDQGVVRDDIPATELASYCLAALTAASAVRSVAGVRRLVMATMAGLHPGPATSVR